jgi:hypothetical protein
MRLSFCALLICIASTAAAQDLPGPPILQLPGSTRSLALGGAYMINGADPDAIFFNPVLLQNARGISLSAQRYGSASTLSSFAFTTDVGLGIGVRVLDYAPGPSLDFDQFGSPLALGNRGFNSAGEVEGVVGYTRTVKKIRLGVAGKWVQHWSANRGAGAASFDVGGTVNPFNWMSVALSVQNIGDGIEMRGITHAFDTRALLLVSTRTKVVGPLDVALAGRMSAGEGSDPQGGVGVETSYYPFVGLTFFARAGGRFGTRAVALNTSGITEAEESHFTAGAGMTYNRVSLDYAWEPFSGAPDAHRVGIRVR